MSDDPTPEHRLALITFDPAPRADLLALRATIDRALLHPGRVVDCRGAFGGAVVRLSMAEGEPEPPPSPPVKWLQDRADLAAEIVRQGAEIRRLRALCRVIESAAFDAGQASGSDGYGLEEGEDPAASLAVLMATVDDGVPDHEVARLRALCHAIASAAEANGYNRGLDVGAAEHLAALMAMVDEAPP